MDDMRTHLERLAEVLRTRRWIAQLARRTGGASILTVANPAAPEFSESVVCRGSAGDFTFCWSWSQIIGPVSEVSGVADCIQHVLRGVES